MFEKAVAIICVIVLVAFILAIITELLRKHD